MCGGRTIQLDGLEGKLVAGKEGTITSVMEVFQIRVVLTPGARYT